MARAQLHSEDWYRVSSLCPRLKPQVDIALHEYRNAPWYVLTDNSSGRSFRLPAEDYEILRRFDGETRIDNIWNDLSWGRSRDLPPQDEFLELLSRLYEAGVIAVDALPRFAGLAKGQRDKSREWITRFMRSPVSQKVPLFNPSQLLEGPALTRLAHLVFGPLGVLVLIATVLGGVYTAVSYWTPLTANLGDRVLEPNNLLIIALVYPFVKLLHEFAHALGVRRYGGSVTNVGIMFLVFVPMPFVDASQANAFRSHGARAIVTAAGILAEFAIAGIAMMMWAQSDPGVFRAVMFNTVLICTVSTVFFNGNPLLRFDAYYVLADLTQTPGLATRGQALLGRVGYRIMGVDPGPDSETGGTGERIWMGTYAVAAAIYRLFIVFAIAFALTGMLGLAGQFLAIWVLVGGLMWPNAKAIKKLVTSPATKTRKWKVMRRFVILFGTAFFLLAVFPLPSRTTVKGVVLADPDASLYASAEGFLSEIFVKDGEQVRAGELLFVLERDGLQVELEAIEARFVATQARLRVAQTSGEGGLADAIGRELGALADGMAQIRQQMENTNIHAERDGIWMFAEPTPTRGALISRGTSLGWIIRDESRRIVAQISQKAGDDLAAGVTAVSVLVSARDRREIPLTQVSYRTDATRSLPDPLLADRLGGPVLTDLESPPEQIRALRAAFNLLIDLPQSDLTPGRTVLVKLSHPPATFFRQVWPQVISTIGSRFGPGA
jgi:putative peptide zinc metalloprotease protein